MLVFDMRSLRVGFVVMVALGTLGACGTKEPDCGCSAQVGSERRVLACGESACVANILQYCEKSAQIIERGACSITSNGGSAAQGGSVGSAPPDDPAPHACDDLRIYCSSSCSSPPAPSTDCQTTASAGDDDACQRWPLTNGILCHP